MKKKELKRQLGISNRTVELQLNEIVSLNKACTSMEKHYDSHMSIAEAEIKRLNVIIHYLEMRDKDEL